MAVCVVEHPLVQHHLTRLRAEGTPIDQWRASVRQVTHLMMYKVTEALPTEAIEVTTPLGPAVGSQVHDERVAVIPILRAGLGMTDAVLDILPGAVVGHVGLERDPTTHRPVSYYCKLPPQLERRTSLVIDPMLATGGSASEAIRLLKEHGAQHVKLIALIAAPEGIRAVQSHHSDVSIYVAAIDARLDSNAYIIPGLGDAGDRLFGTTH